MARERAGTEIRVGLVMYGGVSLAVYMNGVAREFYDMVRGRGVWGAWKMLADVDVVVDVISGASAGGINGLFLAKALAAGREFGPLADLWRANAGIEGLLRDAEEREPASLLDSDYMRDQLKKAFEKIDQSKPATEADLCPSRVEELDCFIATTHYYGFDKTLHDGRGKPVDVRSHRAMFQFRHREGRREPFRASGEVGGPRLSAAELATAARATSAFPFAFRPEELDLETFAPFFVDQDENLSGKAWFVDGGILDNKPFGATLSAISERRADRPVDRLLFYIEPDPEHFETATNLPEPRFEQVALGALTWLPAYESILGDLDSIDVHNRRLERIGSIFGDAMQPWTVAKQNATLPEQQLELYWRARIDDVLTALCEPMKDDALKKLLGSLAQSGSQPQPAKLTREQERTRAIHTLMGMLRDQNGPLPSLPLTRALEGIDLAFLKRAVYYWIYALHKGISPKHDNGIAAEWSDCWKDFTEAPNKETLSEAVRRLNQIADGILVLEASVAWSLASADANAASLNGFLQSWLKGVGDLDAHIESLNHSRRLQWEGRSLATLFKEAVNPKAAQPEASLDRALSLAKALGDALDTVVAGVLPRLRALDTFFNIDVWQFPALHLADVAEIDKIEYFRISPIDSDAPAPWLSQHRWENKRDKMRKVAGRSLAHFSAFLKRSWRSNDILWGRLDAATIAWDAFLNARGHSPSSDRSRLDALASALKEKDPSLAELAATLSTKGASSEEIQRELLIYHQRSIVAEELPRVMRDAMDEELQRRARQSASAADMRPLTTGGVESVGMSVLAQFHNACSDPFLQTLATRAVEAMVTKDKNAFAVESLFAEDYDVGGENVRDLPSPWLEATALQAARVFANMVKGLAPDDSTLGAWAQKHVFARASAILTTLHWVMLSRQAGWFAPLWLIATVGTLGIVISTFFRENPWSSQIDYGAAALLVALLLVPRQWFGGDRRTGRALRILRVTFTLAVPVAGVLLWPRIPASVSTKFLAVSLTLNLALVIVAVGALVSRVKAARRMENTHTETDAGSRTKPEQLPGDSKATESVAEKARTAGKGV